MFFVYIIYSEALDRFYVGYTENLEVRLSQHNSGLSKFSARANDWRLKYAEEYESREMAHKRELEIKRKKSRKYIMWLIAG